MKDHTPIRWLIIMKVDACSESYLSGQPRCLFRIETMCASLEVEGTGSPTDALPPRTFESHQQRFIFHRGTTTTTKKKTYNKLNRPRAGKDDNSLESGTPLRGRLHTIEKQRRRNLLATLYHSRPNKRTAPRFYRRGFHAEPI